jgi:hypothetical protein
VPPPSSLTTDKEELVPPKGCVAIHKRVACAWCRRKSRISPPCRGLYRRTGGPPRVLAGRNGEPSRRRGHDKEESPPLVRIDIVLHTQRCTKNLLCIHAPRQSLPNPSRAGAGSQPGSFRYQGWLPDDAGTGVCEGFRFRGARNPSPPPERHCCVATTCRMFQAVSRQTPKPSTTRKALSY